MKGQKIFLSENLQYLRNRRKITQQDLAEALEISRSKIAHYESGNAVNPPLEDLLAFAEYYKLSIDTLLKIKLQNIGELKLRELEAGNDIYISGGRIRVLSITVNPNNRENIQYVPHKAKAGYLAGYNDLSFIEKLPAFSLPYLPENRTYRMFPTEGDSMLPIPENCMVITEYVTNWNDLKNTPCIVIMRSEQTFLFKEVTLADQTLLLHSLNPVYPDQKVFVGDVLEIWKFHSYITNEIPSEFSIAEIVRGIKDIKTDLKSLICGK